MYNEYTKKLDEMGIKFEYNEFIKDTIRHKIRLVELEKNQDIEEIKEFSKNRNEVGIWITTQIVEVSLDIDFDMLYTEMFTLDSLF